MHIHIASSGEKKEPIVNCIRAVSGIDKVYLLYSKKYENQANILKATMTDMGYACEIKEISGFDFQEIVDRIYSIFDKENGKDVKFSINITGGTNLMAAAACSTAFFIGASIYYIKYNPENPDEPLEDRVVVVPTPKIPDVNTIKGKTRDILEYINDETKNGNGMTSTDIADHFGMSKQTAGYHIGRLRTVGLVDLESGALVNGRINKRSKNVILTREGRMIAGWF